MGCQLSPCSPHCLTTRISAPPLLLPATLDLHFLTVMGCRVVLRAWLLHLKRSALAGHALPRDLQIRIVTGELPHSTFYLTILLSRCMPGWSAGWGSGLEVCHLVRLRLCLACWPAAVQCRQASNLGFQPRRPSPLRDPQAGAATARTAWLACAPRCVCVWRDSMQALACYCRMQDVYPCCNPAAW